MGTELHPFDKAPTEASLGAELGFTVYCRAGARRQSKRSNASVD